MPRASAICALASRRGVDRVSQVAHLGARGETCAGAERQQLSRLDARETVPEQHQVRLRVLDCELADLRVVARPKGTPKIPPRGPPAAPLPAEDCAQRLRRPLGITSLRHLLLRTAAFVVILIAIPATSTATTHAKRSKSTKSPVALATSIAGRYWGVVPCRGHIAILVHQPVRFNSSWTALPGSPSTPRSARTTPPLPRPATRPTPSV